jgi:hypothetical protein
MRRTTILPALVVGLAATFAATPAPARGGELGVNHRGDRDAQPRRRG